MKEVGVGTEQCDKHGTDQIDWKCIYCCHTALFHCGGNYYMCLPCHDEYVNTNGRPTIKECPGDTCPLGIAHPGPTLDADKFGVFPLGCGICRSEKLEILEKKQFRQVIDESNMPKTYRKRNQKEDKIDRPLVEIDMP